MTRHRAQRIAHYAPPGSLLKSFAAPAARPLRPEGERDASYLADIRTLPCLKCGDEPSECAHVRFSSAAFGKTSGMAKKPKDSAAVPLCPGCHRLDRDAQHNRSEREFWHSVGLNPLIVAEKLYAARGDIVRMRMIVMTAIAERGR